MKCTLYSDHSMLLLVIHAHPVPESFSSAIAGSVLKGLRSGGHEVRFKRLYLHGNEKKDCYNGATFPSALTQEEREGYQVPELIALRQTAEGLAKVPRLAAEVKEAIEDLRW